MNQLRTTLRVTMTIHVNEVQCFFSRNAPTWTFWAQVAIRHNGSRDLPSVTLKVASHLYEVHANEIYSKCKSKVLHVNSRELISAFMQHVLWHHRYLDWVVSSRTCYYERGNKCPIIAERDSLSVYPWALRQPNMHSLFAYVWSWRLIDLVTWWY